MTKYLTKYFLGLYYAYNQKGELMLKKIQLKLATKRLEKKSARKATKKARKQATNNTWAKTKEIIAKPFKYIAKLFKRFWNWVCNIDLVGLVNITLLSAIIVLFSMLIIDFTGCNKKPVVVVAKNEINTTQQIQITNKVATQDIKKANHPAPLPLKKDAYTRKFIDAPINVVPVKKDIVAERQTARIENTMYGDVIIDSRGAATMLNAGDKINGNLYIQHMRKYTLPCNIKIEGNLFLRDINMLQFCGDFTVKGNIYVSPDSSFGPIPRTARIGGNVIL